MPFPPPLSPPLPSWPAFNAAVEALDPAAGWIFRGVLCDWEPLTSLDRVANVWHVLPEDRPKLEFRLTRDFQRHPEGAEALGPFARDILYVWALMQHHGAPTRLMDWTYSPYVAAFFALDELIRQTSVRSPGGAKPRGGRATVWALNTTWLNDALKRTLPSHKYEVLVSKKQEPDEFRKVLTTKARDRFICTATPMVLNQRLSLQQGVFLCPGDVTCSWGENLDALGWTPEPQISQAFLLDIPLSEACNYLHRVNVTARTLFPGLDGYSRFMFSRAKLLLAVNVPDDWPE
jgi:hypothetical protein